MYQVDGQYKEALEYAKKDEEIISKYNPKNISGLAYAYYDQGVFALSASCPKSHPYSQV